MPSRNKNRMQVIGQHSIPEKVRAITAHELEGLDNYPSARRVSEERSKSPRVGSYVIAVALKQDSKQLAHSRAFSKGEGSRRGWKASATRRSMARLTELVRLATVRGDQRPFGQE